ncbi:hypothetical protein [Fibrella forsythiae]|uniref:Uncharacterized protein n=1 Tax=Fibrella forsythiae TaxID=2817061 RepID=A0ABS3JQJ1_9BACT|nr:hypothetical protein [Fibrella forsythiae]MBO0951197.1 hypothetical protein [Fibrella forsythiae]
MADSTNKLTGTEKAGLWSNILGTTSSLIGLGTQSLANDATRIKADAALALQKLTNDSTLSTQEYTLAITKIQTERDAKLAEIKIAQRKQMYIGVGALVVVAAVVIVSIVLIVKAIRRK